MSAAVLPDRERALVASAAEWRLIGLLFECPRTGWIDEIAALAAECEDSQLKQAAAAAREEASEGVYHSVLGPGGPAPAREVSYHETLQLGYLMSEIGAFYDAFGYGPKTSEAVDHISVEAGFLSFLHLKRVYALESGHEQAAESAAEAARDFIDRHLRMVAEPLSAILANTGLDYLDLAAQALLRRTGKKQTLPVIGQPEMMLDPDCEIGCGA